MIDPAYYRALFARRFSGEKVILATGMIAGAGKAVELLAQAGARKPLMLAEAIGTGPMPDPDLVDWIIICPDEQTRDLMEGIRRYEHYLANLPDAARSAVETYDPEGSALVLQGLTCRLSRIAGRRVYGYRPAEWAALEDKTAIDPLWDAIGVPRAESRIVPAEPDALRAAARDLDRGDGTVWAADNREGWHGGAEGTRLALDPERWIDWARDHSDRVRVMPFLRGVPCSIHGMVLPDAVIALRPVESVTFIDPVEGRFRYGGCATFWDPPDERRAQMRRLARTVGAALRDRVSFRGTFTIDGVLSDDGFLPTELNPRYGAGIATLTNALPDLPAYWIDQAMCAGEAWEFRPSELEEMIVSGADAVRVGVAKGWCATRKTETETVPIVQEPSGDYRRAAGDETPDATIELGPSPLGCFLRISLDPERNPIGESVAPRSIRALQFADRELGTRFHADRLRACE